MMQGTGAAFQAPVSLKKQATDPMSHTPVQSYANLSESYSLPAKSDGRPFLAFSDPFSLSPDPITENTLRRGFAPVEDP
jgi:hypothetical protein